MVRTMVRWQQGFVVVDTVTDECSDKSIMYPQQNQYAFIPDALSDYITCGDTSVMAHELRFVIGDMEKKDESGQSGFEKQFEVEL